MLLLFFFFIDELWFSACKITTLIILWTRMKNIFKYILCLGLNDLPKNNQLYQGRIVVYFIDIELLTEHGGLLLSSTQKFQAGSLLVPRIMKCSIVYKASSYGTTFKTEFGNQKQSQLKYFGYDLKAQIWRVHKLTKTITTQ